MRYWILSLAILATVAAPRASGSEDLSPSAFFARNDKAYSAKIGLANGTIFSGCLVELSSGSWVLVSHRAVSSVGRRSLNRRGTIWIQTSQICSINIEKVEAEGKAEEASKIDPGEKD